MSDDRVIPLRPPRAAADQTPDVPQDTAEDAVPDRVMMGVEVPADRRTVLMVQTIAQLATLAQDAGVPLDDGLAEGAERLARSLRGTGLDLPPHLESALEEISRALSPQEDDGEGGVIVPFRVVDHPAE